MGPQALLQVDGHKDTNDHHSTHRGLPLVRPRGEPCHYRNVITIFNKHGYQVTDATDKEFVGIRISRDDHFNYYMDQHRMIETIIEEAGINGTKDEHLPYPNSTQQPKPLSKLDCAQTDEEKIKSSRYPYRRVVGQLMYGMVHTMVCIMYALNVLSRYGNNPGDRHFYFL
jgi:hypothetical protein